MNRVLSPRTLTYMAIVFVAYLGVSFAFAALRDSIDIAPAIVWPASGIALAAVILGGYIFAPVVGLASFIYQLVQGNGITIALGIGLANALQPFLAAYLLKRFDFNSMFARVPDTIAFAAVAFFVTMVVPTIGSLVFLLDGRSVLPGFQGTWFPWWVGQMLSALAVTPLLIRWLPRMRVDRTPIEWLEAGLAFASLIAVDILLFWTPYTHIAGVPLAYLLMGPFLWLALRIGPRFMTLALLVNAVLVIAGTIIYADANGLDALIGQRLLQGEIFTVMISFVFLLLVSIAEERKDTANELRDHVDQLEIALERISQEDEAKGQFIATLAHELRNPLAPLMSSLELMKLEKPSGAKLEETVDAMSEHIRTMRHLLDDLLDVSRISRQKMTLKKEYTDLHGVIAKSQRTIQPFIDERKHTLTLVLPDDAILFEADPVRLEQIIVNLLNNAAKYSDPGTTITLTATLENGLIVLRITDQGIGIEPAMLATIFDPFMQIKQHGRLVSGLGIGLSLTKNLVEMHEGTIEARSEGLGHGSEFIVRIPVPSETNTAEASDTTAMHQNDAHAGLRILVVDDNRAAADALTKLLTLRGHTVETAYTGAEAIERAQPFKPQVVMLDIGLPDQTGYQVATKLRALPGFDATLIALSGYGQESDKREAASAGFAHHLVKPAGLADIEAILSQIQQKG